MKHYEARLSSKGQLTVPSEIRELLGLKEGDRVDFYADSRTPAARLVARNATFSDLRGILETGGHGRKIPLTSEAIADAIGEHLVEKHARIGREWNEWREFEAWKKARSMKAAE